MEVAEYLGKEDEEINRTGPLSLEVIREAVNRIVQWDLVCIDDQEVKMTVIGDIDNVQAFVCYKESHSIAVRKIRGNWYNLNPTNETIPGA